MNETYEKLELDDSELAEQLDMIAEWALCNIYDVPILTADVVHAAAERIRKFEQEIDSLCDEIEELECR